MWGQGPLDNDLAHGVVLEQQRALLDTVHTFCADPQPVSFARAYAAIELLLLLAENPLVPVPREAVGWRESILVAFDGSLSAHYEDLAQLRALREGLEARLTRLAERARQVVPLTSPGGELRAALARQAEVPNKDYLFPFEELYEWLEPRGYDAHRAWSESERADHMVALAQASGAPHETLRVLVVQLLAPTLASLPQGAPHDDAEALEKWALQTVRGGAREQLVVAQRARAAAHLLRAEAPSTRNHLGLAVKVVLDAAALAAAIVAERGGLSRQAAMTDADGPGWRAYHAENRALAGRLRALSPELPRVRAEWPGLRRARG